MSASGISNSVLIFTLGNELSSINVSIVSVVIIRSMCIIANNHIAMYSSPTVAVAGASGRLGKHVIKSLQTPKFKHKFGNVVALVRDTTPQDIIDAWKSQGVTVRIYNEKNMADSLKGIDVLINAYVVALKLAKFSSV